MGIPKKMEISNDYTYGDSNTSSSRSSRSNRSSKSDRPNQISTTSNRSSRNNSNNNRTSRSKNSIATINNNVTEENLGTRKFSIGVKLIITGFCFYIISSVLYNATTYISIISEKELLQSELLYEKEQNEKYQEQLTYMRSDENIEKIAREQLGMVKPNEIMYINNSNLSN